MNSLSYTVPYARSLHQRMDVRPNTGGWQVESLLNEMSYSTATFDQVEKDFNLIEKENGRLEERRSTFEQELLQREELKDKHIKSINSEIWKLEQNLKNIDHMRTPELQMQRELQLQQLIQERQVEKRQIEVQAFNSMHQLRVEFLDAKGDLDLTQEVSGWK